MDEMISLRREDEVFCFRMESERWSGEGVFQTCVE